MKSERRFIKASGSNWMYVLTVASFLLIIWEMEIYRKTFISVFIPIAVWIVSGFLAFLYLNKRSKLYLNDRSPFWLRVFHGVFTFGAIVVFLFMALNYYVPVSATESKILKVVKANRFGRRRGTGDPYVVALYKNQRKQLVFPHDVEVENCISVHVRIRKGLFGFETVESAELGAFREVTPFAEEAGQYKKLKWKAEEYFVNGDTEKAIELYERAVKLRPSDKNAIRRLKELRAL